MRLKLSLVMALTVLLIANSVVLAKKKNVRTDPVVPKTKHPTYGEEVEDLGKKIFPERAEYEIGGVKVGVKRDNCICERCERDGNNWFITCRARYVGTYKVLGASKEVGADRARIYYDNGAIKVDMGGLKGVVNTKDAKKVFDAAIKKWTKGEK